MTRSRFVFCLSTAVGRLVKVTRSRFVFVKHRGGQSDDKSLFVSAAVERLVFVTRSRFVFVKHGGWAVGQSDEKSICFS